MSVFSLSEKCKSKPQWGTISCGSEWLLSKSLQAINAGEDVEKREPSYTVGGNANLSILFNTLDNSTILDTLLLIDHKDTHSASTWFVLRHCLRHLCWHLFFFLTIKYRSAQSFNFDLLLNLASFSVSVHSTWCMYIQWSTWHHYILMEVSKFQAFRTFQRFQNWASVFLLWTYPTVFPSSVHNNFSIYSG